MNALKQVVALAERVDLNVVGLVDKARGIKNQISAGEEIRANLFGIERKARDAIYVELSKLREQEAQINRQERMADVAQKYQRLSLEPLSWRDKQGWPRLVVFSLGSSEFSIDSDGGRNPQLPGPLTERYNDIEQKLKGLKEHKHYNNAYNKTIKVSCSFEGVFPPEVRKKISLAEKDFGYGITTSNIFIIAEPKNFSLTQVARVDPDPLVVGYKHGALWLIAEFDITPVEEVMVFHFDDGT